jgi:guanosine-3',5'-bis(diphosphate) 3'-pyrophosphohydrolase
LKLIYYQFYHYKMESREELENKQLRNNYRTLLRSCQVNLNAEDKKLIRKAFNFAMSAHNDVRRKSGELYIFHPLAVAVIVAKEIGLGVTSIVSSFLHDVVEDTDITLEEIEAIFGKKIARIIDGLTKISGVIGHTRSMQAENFRKILLTLSEDVRVILIKLADRLHNMRTLDAVPNKTQLKIASETLEMFAPLAHRLGLYAIKTELEDLALKYTEPPTYQELYTKIQANKEQINKYTRTFIRPIQTSLEKQGFEYEIKGRFKSVYSIYKKMKYQSIPFDRIFDLFAIRIIIENSTHEKADCWRVYSIVTDFYRPNPERLRDWVSNPKINGYESLHTTVMGPRGKWVEVQIRTRRMHEIAERGYAAHWKYKEGENSESGLDEWIKQIGEVLKTSTENAVEFFDEFKFNLFSKEVYVFTPKGELKSLPAGSTVLDFAYEIHTDVGETCLGAKIDNKTVPLSHILQNGNQVEIITSKKQYPKQEWINYVVTAKARSKIKQFLRNQRRKTAENGKQILVKKVSVEKNESKNKVINDLLEFFQLHNELDLYYNIGSSKIKNTDLNHALKIVRMNEEEKKSNIPGLQQDKKGLIVIGGEEDVDYILADCCNPIPGDDIFAFATMNKGVVVHRTNCPKGIKLMANYGYRIADAQWIKEEIEEMEAYMVGVRLTGFDNKGIMSSVTDIISNQFDVDMQSIYAKTIDGAFDGKITLKVSNTKHLEDLIHKLKAVDGVESVSRFHVEEEID